ECPGRIGRPLPRHVPHVASGKRGAHPGEQSTPHPLVPRTPRENLARSRACPARPCLGRSSLSRQQCRIRPRSSRRAPPIPGSPRSPISSSSSTFFTAGNPNPRNAAKQDFSATLLGCRSLCLGETLPQVVDSVPRRIVLKHPV